LLVPPGVLRPPSDTFMLADQLRREVRGNGVSVLDLCSGSGMLAIAAARAGARHVTAVDISRRAVLATWLNAKLNAVAVEVVRGDLFAAVPGRRFEVIVSNPPYLVSASEELPQRGARRAWDAGPDGRLLLDPICAQAHHHLSPGGVLLLVHSSLCDEGRTVEQLSRRGYEVEITFRHRGALGERMHARAPMLRARGLLPDGEFEDLVVVRAQLQRA
jgi:release factor glutamine methyltransferase